MFVYVMYINNAHHHRQIHEYTLVFILITLLLRVPLVPELIHVCNWMIILVLIIVRGSGARCSSFKPYPAIAGKREKNRFTGDTLLYGYVASRNWPLWHIFSSGSR